MIVLGRMMIDLKHEPGIQVVRVREVRCYAHARALPERFLNVAVVNKTRFVREKEASRFIVSQKCCPQRRLSVAAVICHSGAGHVEDVSLAIREIPSLEQ